MIVLNFNVTAEVLDRILKGLRGARWTSGRAQDLSQRVAVLFLDSLEPLGRRLIRALEFRGFPNVRRSAIAPTSGESQIAAQLRQYASSWCVVFVVTRDAANGAMGTAILAFSRRHPDVVVVIASQEDLHGTPLDRYEIVGRDATGDQEEMATVKAVAGASLQRAHHLKDLLRVGRVVSQLLILAIVVAGIFGWFARGYLARNAINSIDVFDAVAVRLPHARSHRILGSVQSLDSGELAGTELGDGLQAVLVDVEFQDHLRECQHALGALPIYAGKKQSEAEVRSEGLHRFLDRENAEINIADMTAALEYVNTLPAVAERRGSGDPRIHCYASFRILATGASDSTFLSLQTANGGKIVKLSDGTFFFGTTGSQLFRSAEGGSNKCDTLMVINMVSKAPHLRVFGVKSSY